MHFVRIRIVMERIHAERFDPFVQDCIELAIIQLDRDVHMLDRASQIS